MKIFNKFAAIFLACLMLAGALAGCAEKVDPAENTTAPEAVSTVDPADETTKSLYDKNGYLLDDLDESLDFGADKVKILYWSDRLHEEMISDGITGEVVSDAIYQRNEAVKGRLNIDFEYITARGDAGNVANFTSVVENGIKAGDQPYDIVSAHSFTIGNCAAKGLLYDLSDCKYLNFEQPWWPSTLISKATINGKLFFVSGDISANAIYMMYVTFFNKELIEEYKLEDPYTLVSEKKWTIDKQLEMCKDVYIDMNNNGVKDIGDQFGQYAYTNHLDTFLWGSDVVVIDTTGETPVISDAFKSEKVHDLQDKLRTFFYSSQDGLVLTVNSSVHQHFQNGLSLFWNDCCRNATRFATTDLSYGIVPIPMYDEDQDYYTTLIANPFSLYAVPNDTAKADELCAVIECMASESYRNISPALYETAMKYKYSRDDKSAQMFDIVKSTVVFDLGRIFSSSLSTPSGIWQQAITGGTPWSTTMKAQGKMLDKYLAELMKAFE